MFAKITTLSLVILTALCAFFWQRSQHWQNEYDLTAAQLTDVSEKYGNNLKMLEDYQKQAEQLNDKLQRLQTQAAQRETELNEALSNEQNKKWAGDLVPDDVIGVLKRTIEHTGTNSPALPANHRMQADE